MWKTDGELSGLHVDFQLFLQKKGRRIGRRGGSFLLGFLLVGMPKPIDF